MSTAHETTLMCESPKGQPTAWVNKGLDELMFAECPAFSIDFAKSVGSACDVLGRALGDVFFLQSEDVPPFGRIPLARVMEPAFEALPSSCVQGMTRQQASADALRSIDDAPEWRACSLPSDVVRGDDKLGVAVGTYLYAIAIAPHLTPLGRHFLRKFIVCARLLREGRWRDPADLGEP